MTNNAILKFSIYHLVAAFVSSDLQVAGFHRKSSITLLTVQLLAFLTYPHVLNLRRFGDLSVGVVDCYLLVVDGVDSAESEPDHLDYAPHLLLANIRLNWTLRS